MTTVPRSTLPAPRVPLCLLAPLAAALAFGLPQLAQAQQSAGNAFAVTLVDESQQGFSGADCLAATQRPIAYTWGRAGTPTPGQEERVFVTRGSSCTDTAAANILELVTKRPRVAGQQSSANFTNAEPTPRQLFALASPTRADDCGGTAGVEAALLLCVQIETPAIGGGNPTTSTGSYRITVDSRPPAAPTLTAVEALEGGLVARWTMPTETLGAAGYRVYVTPPGGAETVTDVTGGAVRELSLDGLALGTPYAVQVSAVDAAGNPARPSTLGNESARSNTLSGTPVAIQDFFERYGQVGGQETGGCASGGVPLFALAGLGLLARRRRRVAGVAAVLAGGLLAAPATAQVRLQEDTSVVRRSERQSPQRFTAELLLGPFQPGIDSEPGLTATPFRDIFGDANPALTRLSFSYDFFRSPFGRFGAGATVGYWQATGGGVYENDPTRPSLDEVTLAIAPITPFLSYRADFLYDRWSVPLVPYAKLGYGFAWWSSQVNGRTSRRTLPDGTTATADGWARGLEYAAGLQLALDFLEPGQAAALDSDLGINSTALFVEVTGAHWQGASGLRLGNTALAGGLALMF